MGACLGHCFSIITDHFSNRSYQRHTSMHLSGEEQFEYSQPVAGQNTSRFGSKNLLSLLSLKRFKNKRRIPVTLELLEDTGWKGRSNKYARLSSHNTPSTSSGLDNLQLLDARNLLKYQGPVSSTPDLTSSIDLEWENEGLPLPAMNADKKRDSPEESPSESSVNNPTSLTASGWSRISTPNSLEWDPVEADMVCVDIETEKLLSEIERLTDRALKETGEWTSDS